MFSDKQSDFTDMTDVVDPSTRSRMMSGIRGKDTQPELIVRRYLHAKGLRFRLHDRTLPGRPDLVLRRHRAVVFVHGCFWHQHPGCRFAVMPTQNRKFWAEKLGRNRTRDLDRIAALESAGWRVFTVWECELAPVQLDALAHHIRCDID
jgi:DNA mismatch endonuclease, patch repair protein